MNNFPMYLAQIDCQTILTFRFKIPEQDIGRDDITIYVEYGANVNSKELITYNVWAQFDGDAIRAYLTTFCIPGHPDDPNVIDKIVLDLNSQEQFYARLHDFIIHFTQHDQ